MAVAVGVAGLGSVLPERVVTNDDYAAFLDTSDEWITTRTGIRRRRHAGPGDTTTSLATEAARLTLADAGLDSVDAVIVATTSPDTMIPQVAPRVAAALGLTAGAFDLGAGCSGFVYALATGTGLIAAGAAQDVLIVGAEVLSRHTDQNDRTTAVLLADGAAGVVLSAGAEGSVGPFDLGSDGGGADLLCIPDGGRFITMRGREVYRHAVERMATSARSVLDAAQLDTDDVDVLVAHQANARILEAVASRLGIDAERCVVTVQDHGNTSAASIPLALSEAREAGRLTKGDRVLLTAFGAGLTWASALVTWGTA